MDIVEETKQKIAIMQAFVDGKRIKAVAKHGNYHSWGKEKEPVWDWARFNYTILDTKPSINWDHVSPNFKWLAVDKNGYAYLYESEPVVGGHDWSNANQTHEFAEATGFVSFNAGDCDWDKSLIKRP